MTPHALLLSLIVAAPAPAAPLQESYAVDLEVRGLRPSTEVKRALKDAAPALAACVKADGVAVVDMEILAAGFVDRVAVVDESEAFATACVVDALKKLPMADRGKEPPTHAVIRFVAGEPAPPGTSPADVALVVNAERDRIATCVESARRATPALAGTLVAHLVVRADGRVARVEADGGSLPSSDARACIASLLEKVRFAGGRTVEARVTVPLTFDKKSPPPPDPKPRSFLDKPTLFAVLGCSSPLP